MPKIPKATAKRLPLYYRYLRSFADMGKKRISSGELSDAVKIDSATIRRDFSHFGTLGKRGYGYDVEKITEFFNKQLYRESLTTVGLIGVGHLGNALIHYNFKKSNSVRIGAGFDVNEELIGTVQNGVPIYSIDDVVDTLQDMSIKIVILAVPESHVQDVVDKLKDTDVEGILNFTPARLEVPEGMFVQNVDLANELQTLIYYIGVRHQNENND